MCLDVCPTTINSREISCGNCQKNTHRAFILVNVIEFEDISNDFDENLKIKNVYKQVADQTNADTT